VTGGERCQEIAAWIVEKGGPHLDPIADIWNMDPRGELWPVMLLYNIMEIDKHYDGAFITDINGILTDGSPRPFLYRFYGKHGFVSLSEEDRNDQSTFH
jgi:hypothetical protein